jgi:hypothetical protein
VGQGRFDLHCLVGRDHLPLAAQCAHLFGRLQRAVELLLRRIEVQDALRALVIAEAGIAAQLLQRVAAVGAQAHDLLDVVARARRRAFAQELEPQSHWRMSARMRKSSGASSFPSHCSTFSGALGLAQGSAWLTEIWPPLAKLVSAAGVACRSITVTSWPSCWR